MPSLFISSQRQERTNAGRSEWYVLHFSSVGEEVYERGHTGALHSQAMGRVRLGDLHDLARNCHSYLVEDIATQPW